MRSQSNIRTVEMLRYLYQHTDENRPILNIIPQFPTLSAAIYP